MTGCSPFTQTSCNSPLQTLRRQPSRWQEEYHGLKDGELTVARAKPSGKGSLCRQPPSLSRVRAAQLYATTASNPFRCFDCLSFSTRRSFQQSIHIELGRIVVELMQSPGDAWVLAVYIHMHMQLAP